MAEETAARVAPKNTTLLAAVGLKLIPVRVTVVPTGPDEGEKPVITGFVANACVKDRQNRITRTAMPFFLLCITFFIGVLIGKVWGEQAF